MNFNKTNLFFFSACYLGKIHKFPFLTSTAIYEIPLQLIFEDLWDSFPSPSANGYIYYISFIDASTRYIWIYMLKHKSDALHIFQTFKTYVELQLNYKILALQTNRNGEFRACIPFE